MLQEFCHNKSAGGESLGTLPPHVRRVFPSRKGGELHQQTREVLKEKTNFLAGEEGRKWNNYREIMRAGK